MNFFAGIALIAALKALNYYIGNNTKKKLVYVSNGKESTQSFLVRSYDVLGLEHKQSISPDIIMKAFHKQLELSTDDRLRGYKPIYSLKELQAAKTYLNDYITYFISNN